MQVFRAVGREMATVTWITAGLPRESLARLAKKKARKSAAAVDTYNKESNTMKIDAANNANFQNYLQQTQAQPTAKPPAPPQDSVQLSKAAQGSGDVDHDGDSK